MEKNEVLDNLSQLTIEAAELADRIALAVNSARAAGATWAEIAHKMGISRQAVHKKYAATAPSIETLPLSDPAFNVLFQAPQIHSDPEPAPSATNVDDAAPATAEKESLRTQHRIPQPEATAQPGIGKGQGPHTCPSCGSSNHKTENPKFAGFNAECIPTQYDPPNIAFLIWSANR